MRPIDYPETSAMNCQYKLRDNPQQRIFLSYCGGNLKSHVERKLFEVPFEVVTDFVFDAYKPKLNCRFSSFEMSAVSLGKYLPTFRNILLSLSSG